MTSRKTKVAGFLGTVAVTGGLLASAVVGTGAYFSDTVENNHITGTMGSIQVEGHDGTGDNNLDAAFADMLPGETKSAKFRYSNTGKNAQDVGSCSRARIWAPATPRPASTRSGHTARSTSPATALSCSPVRT